ncbi:MAG TPA: KH domain-containing protein [Candidatus Polarisedimenticolia bacterium]
MRRWAEEMVRDLVDRTDAVEVQLFDEEEALVLEVTVDPTEMGRVIGRQGRTVQALRTLLEVAGAKQGVNYELEILE